MKKFLIALCIIPLSACGTTHIVPQLYMPTPPTELMKEPGKLVPVGAETPSPTSEAK